MWISFLVVEDTKLVCYRPNNEALILIILFGFTIKGSELKTFWFMAEG